MFIHGSGASSRTATNRTVPSGCGWNTVRSGTGTDVAGFNAEIAACSVPYLVRAAVAPVPNTSMMACCSPSVFASA